MQELRLLAHISKEPEFIRALEQNKDLHCYSAALLYNIPYDNFMDENGEVKSSMKHYRTAAKSINFGLIYGMGVTKLAGELDISVDDAKSLINRYFDTFPYIKKLMDKLAFEAQKNRYAFSILDGRRRDLTSFNWDDRKEKAHATNIAKNLPFQGTHCAPIALCYYTQLKIA